MADFTKLLGVHVPFDNTKPTDIKLPFLEPKTKQFFSTPTDSPFESEFEFEPNSVHIFEELDEDDSENVNYFDEQESSDPSSRVIGALGRTAAGTAAGAAASAAAWGVASSAAASAGLYGAAATSSALATLGGGSLVAGGLGMAGGTALLVAAPVVGIIGGIALGLGFLFKD